MEWYTISDYIQNKNKGGMVDMKKYTIEINERQYTILKEEYYRQKRLARRAEIIAKVLMVFGVVLAIPSLFMASMSLFVNYYEWEETVIACIAGAGCFAYFAGWKLFYIARDEDPWDGD